MPSILICAPLIGCPLASVTVPARASIVAEAVIPDRANAKTTTAIFLTGVNITKNAPQKPFAQDFLLDRKCAGGGARTHTILRSLDFESSASASSATPAAGTGSYENGAQAQALPTKSNGCKLRGGPKISRRIIAWRKPTGDFRSAITSFCSAVIFSCLTAT